MAIRCVGCVEKEALFIINGNSKCVDCAMVSEKQK